MICPKKCVTVLIFVTQNVLIECATPTDAEEDTNSNAAAVTYEVKGGTKRQPRGFLTTLQSSVKKIVKPYESYTRLQAKLKANKDPDSTITETVEILNGWLDTEERQVLHKPNGPLKLLTRIYVGPGEFRDLAILMNKRTLAGDFGRLTGPVPSVILDQFSAPGPCWSSNCYETALTILEKAEQAAKDLYRFGSNSTLFAEIIEDLRRRRELLKWIGY